MAQGGKMPGPGAGAGARLEEEAAPTAYGGIEADRLVVLAKPLPLPSGAGYYCAPVAVVRFQDLPEELRRKIAAASTHAAGAGAGAGAAARPKDPNDAPVAPLLAEGDAVPVRVDVVPEEGLGLRHQLPGLVSRPGDEPAVKFAGGGILRLMEDDGKVTAWLNASSLHGQVLGVGDMERSLSGKEKVLPHAWNWMGQSGSANYKLVANESSEPSNMAAERAADAYTCAVYDDGLPAGENAAPDVVAVLLGNNRIIGARALDACSDGLAAFPPEDAVAFVEALLGDGRATEHDANYNHDVLVPAAGEALRGHRSPAYAVQVWVDAAAGGKAGDAIAVSGKAAGADAGNERRGSLQAVLGVVVASSAATALAAGSVGPATAFGLFAALLGGLSLAMASVRGW